MVYLGGYKEAFHEAKALNFASPSPSVIVASLLFWRRPNLPLFRQQYPWRIEVSRWSSGRYPVVPSSYCSQNNKEAVV